MVLHFNNVVAKGDSGTKAERDRFLTKVTDLVHEHQVDILMMDANMALLMVFDSLRRSGVKCDLAAWTPWQLIDGTRCMDSCAIVFINKPGVYTLTKGIDDLHGENRDGLNWPSAPQRADTDDLGGGPVVRSGGHAWEGTFKVWDSNVSHGHPYAAFHPKGASQFQEKLQQILQPSTSPKELEYLARRSGRSKDNRKAELWGDSAESYKRSNLLVKEMKVHQEHYNWDFPPGSHYPLCAATDMNGNRSDEGKQRKKDRMLAQNNPELQYHLEHNKTLTEELRRKAKDRKGWLNDVWASSRNVWREPQESAVADSRKSWKDADWPRQESAVADGRKDWEEKWEDIDADGYTLQRGTDSRGRQWIKRTWGNSSDTRYETRDQEEGMDMGDYYEGKGGDAWSRRDYNGEDDWKNDSRWSSASGSNQSTRPVMTHPHGQYITPHHRPQQQEFPGVTFQNDEPGNAHGQAPRGGRRGGRRGRGGYSKA